MTDLQNHRRSYTLHLLITPQQPLSHGMGTVGNVQMLRTTEANALIDGKWRRISYPAVSGGALKSTLREMAVGYFLDRQGLTDGTVGRDMLRLLLKGGKVTAGGQGVSHDETRRLCTLFPMLSVFGFMDGNISRPGLLTPSEVRPYTEELVAAGVMQSWDGLDPATPIPLALCRSEVTYYAHDLGSGRQAKRLAAEDRKQLEGAVDTRAALTRASTDERRAASEAMPHSYQVIPPGTPMVATLHLRGADEIELACLLIAISEWSRAGGILGGASGAKGHGQCSVKILSATRYHAGAGPIPVDASVQLPAETLDTEAESRRLLDAYLAHLDSVHDAVMREVAA